MRIDTMGRDVTDSPGLWSESDMEICVTQYSHPSSTTGQHTNGPANIFVRCEFWTDEWILSRERTVHDTVQAFLTLGFGWFICLDEE
jgi:hypothetical protein